MCCMCSIVVLGVVDVRKLCVAVFAVTVVAVGAGAATGVVAAAMPPPAAQPAGVAAPAAASHA